MRGIRLLKRLGAAVRHEQGASTYSQCGEDQILRFLFDLLEISKPSYLDIGAHHPTYLSNTFLFYSKGARGVCVEPNPVLYRHIQAKRPGDTCLNVGIAAGAADSLNFFIFDDLAMSTFSEEIRDEQLAAGRKLVQTQVVKVRSVNDVMAEQFPDKPNFISLDTEGFDLAILETMNFDRYRPEAFCIETITNVEERKMTEIIDFMASRDYVIYADTYVNTIFADKKVWDAKLKQRTAARLSRGPG